MEIEDIRQELNHLLDNIVEHSKRYSDERPIPSLEISFVLTKINKMQENLSVLRHLLKEKEKATIHAKNTQPEESIKEEPLTTKASATITTNETKKETIEEVVNRDIEVQDEEQTQESKVNLELPPIAKLVDALTLNDRYLYANELFEKDMNAFNELVKSIDESSSLNEAKELYASFEWDEENEHVISFNILVERRFS